MSSTRSVADESRVLAGAPVFWWFVAFTAEKGPQLVKGRTRRRSCRLPRMPGSGRPHHRRCRGLPCPDYTWLQQGLVRTRRTSTAGGGERWYCWPRECWHRSWGRGMPSRLGRRWALSLKGMTRTTFVSPLSRKLRRFPFWSDPLISSFHELWFLFLFTYFFY